MSSHCTLPNSTIYHKYIYYYNEYIFVYISGVTAHPLVGGYNLADTAKLMGGWGKGGYGNSWHQRTREILLVLKSWGSTFLFIGKC